MDEEKFTFCRSLEGFIRLSAGFYHYPYIERKYEKWGEKEIKNSLIFLIISSLELADYSEWRDIAASNDIIFLSLFHHYEIDPI
jgi:hypothetical protein